MIALDGRTGRPWRNPRMKSTPQIMRSPRLVGLAAFFVLTSIAVVLSQGQDPKDLKGKTRQVTPVPNGTVNAGEIEFHEDANHQGDPTPSPTASPNTSPSPSPSTSPGGSPTPIPGPTPGAYEIIRSEGVAIVPGETDIGSNCNFCVTEIQLPFSYTLYDQPFNSARVSSNGALEFVSQVEDSGPACLPYQRFSYTILPLWSFLIMENGSVFTSTSGAAPNRVFNIEWRAQFPEGTEAHFEVRLYEGQTRFEIIYGNVEGNGANATIGVQKYLGDSYTEFSCNGSNQINAGTSLMFTLNSGTFPAPPQIQVTPTSVNLTVNTLLGSAFVPLRVVRVNNDGSTLDVTTTPETTYDSGDWNIANVDSFGNVGGVNEGSTVITVINRNSMAQVPVTVSTFTPGQLSSLAIPGTANSVAVSGNYAYVAAGSAGLQVVDVSNRQSPVVVGALDTAGDAKDVKVLGNLAYLADGSGGLCVIDVSNPALPVLVGVANVSGGARDLAVGAGRAYVAAEAAGLQIFDVNNPAAPVLLGTLATAGRARAVDVSGSIGVIACEPATGSDGSIVIADLANPSTPQVIGTVNVQGVPDDLLVRDRLAYVGNESGATTEVIDFSTPTRPLQVKRDFRGQSIAGVAAFGRYAFFGFTPLLSGSMVYDLNDPSSPIFTGSITFSPPATYLGTGVAVDSQFLYQTGYHLNTAGALTDSLLFIGQYQTTGQAVDSLGFAPTVSIDSPQNGDTVIEGSELFVSATAADDVQVAAVSFSINGVTVATDYAAPYGFTAQIPMGGSNLTLQATAVDLAGNTRLSAPVNLNVITDPPPTVQFIRPEATDQLTGGLTSDVFVDAQDNAQVTKIEFFLNGVKLEGDYFSFAILDVPAGISSLTIEARATDNLGQVGSATRTVAVVPYTGPTTTVTGRVLDGPGVPVPGLTVSVFNAFTAQTDADGAYSFSGVPTIRGGIVPFVRGQFNGRTISICQFSWDCPLPQRQPVADGVTDLGDLILTRQLQQDLFITPTTAAVGSVEHVLNFDDLFIGSDSFNRFYWPGGFSGSQGGRLIPWTSTTTLPFAGVKSAEIFQSHIYTQLNDQPGQVTDFAFVFDQNVLRFVPQTTSIDSGLTVDAESIAAAADTVGPRLPVLAFLGTTTDGAVVNVRIGDGAGGFNPAVALPTETGEQLRTLKLHDVNRDGLVDLLAIRSVSPTESHLVVYPRVSASAFGAPVESPITMRSTPAAATTVDYAVAEFDATQSTTIAVLGDDRVRLYAGDANGAFLPSGDINLANGTVPLAIAGRSYHRGGSFFDDVKGALVVTTIPTGEPTLRNAYVYLNKGSGFDPAAVYGYRVPDDAVTDNARVFIGGLDSSTNFEVVAVDGRYLTVLYQILPLNGL